jgi:NTP pyrophosphatase (non-canonical NTP hydrolase)
MDFSSYQQQSRRTALYPDRDRNFLYPTLGLCGEAGEVAEKVKKVIRDQGGEVSEETRRAIAAELGDVLWYVAQLATELDLELGAIAQANLDKLQSRLERGAIQGSGDRR